MNFLKARLIRRVALFSVLWFIGPQEVGHGIVSQFAEVYGSFAKQENSICPDPIAGRCDHGVIRNVWNAL